MRCLIADDGDSVVATADALTAAGANLRNIQLLGTGLWDNPRVYASPALQGGLYAAPDPSGFRAFSGRYRTKYGAEPVRTATLAYDAVALVAALARTQGGQRYSPEVLTNPSGFAGIDGLFRFRPDGTNERGLAVMRVANGGSVPVAGSPKSFGALEAADATYAAKSATTASSTGNPACVTRSRPPSSTDDRALLAQHGDAARIERAAGERRIAPGVDALGEPQAHQQKFVGALFAVEAVVGDDAVAVGLDPHQPCLGALFGRDRVPDAVDIEPAMRAGTDAGIFLAAPVDQIVPAFRAFSRVIGNLVGRQPMRAADLLRDVIERARGRFVRRLQLARGVQAEERRALFDRQLIERQMFGRFRDGELQLIRPHRRRLVGTGVDQVERIALEGFARDRDRIQRFARGSAAAPAPSARHRRAPARRARRG